VYTQACSTHKVAVHINGITYSALKIPSLFQCSTTHMEEATTTMLSRCALVHHHY
jgi:hypothetical protein